MPRYEFQEGTSSKFWEIALEGTSFTTTYGRLGTDGQTSLKEWESEARAKKEHDKLVAEKVKKGYLLVDGGGGAAPAPAAAPGPAKAAPAPAPKAAPAPAPKAAPAPKGKAVFEDEGDDEDDAPPAKPVKSAAAPAAKPAAASGASKSGEEGARYFEFVDGASSKFWEIKLEGTSFTTRYGKIGTDGQQSLKEYDSDAKAKAEHDKLVAEKVKKGYVEK
jgi:predicted DNA-binding WGR domain protein